MPLARSRKRLVLLSSSDVNSMRYLKRESSKPELPGPALPKLGRLPSGPLRSSPPAHPYYHIAPARGTWIPNGESLAFRLSMQVSANVLHFSRRPANVQQWWEFAHFPNKSHKNRQLPIAGSLRSCKKLALNHESLARRFNKQRKIFVVCYSPMLSRKRA
jgi:hypothetical protein